MPLINQADGTTIAERATPARSVWARAVGWMGRRDVAGDEAIGVARCDWAHTFFVRFPLDLAYCDAAGRVLRVAVGVRPNRWGPRVPGAAVVWEMRSPSPLAQARPGDVLVFRAGVQ